MSKRIMVVEDEEAIARLISYNLQKEGYEVQVSGDGLDALRKIRSEKPDLLILDIMLPGMDGYEICQAVRKEDSSLPVIMLSARDDELDKILGLELGGDDYLTKPFSPRELVARVRALLRRAQTTQAAPDHETFLIDRLAVDFSGREISVNDQIVPLTPKEFELMEYLIRHRGKVVSRDQLLDRVWNYDFAGDTRIVDVHISRLREKIEPDPKNPSYIQTVRGVGYRFKERG
ncbi:response regulator transcription factor [Dehalobacter restrictus]|uniref:Stage 0 sporulation protein A homolog n=1 Tax=Dehalobacter restrictus TaxID=55583 RepID=A0A857DMI4_9FIRM|nr:response regulator transcription factor [Dehalobacter restrictus]QHA01652.1 response regulator [Dehalobacter restrictus]